MQEKWHRAALYLAGGAAVTDLVSVAACDILLGGATLALLLSRKTLRFPPVMLPLVLFMAGTVMSMLLDDAPSLGLPYIKKFFVFLMLIVVYNTFRSLQELLGLVCLWAATAAVQALWSFKQYLDKQEQALELGRNFYHFYVGNRVTGFLNHWMTFSGVQMMAFLVVLSLLLLWPQQRKIEVLFGFCGTLILVSIVLGDTRSVWAATSAGAVYLVWMRRRKLILLLPAVGLAGFLIAPAAIQERLVSIYKPHGTVDSNQHRYVTSRTGIAMIQAHPWVGLGPGIVTRDFMKWVPPDIPRPLPDGFYGHLHSIYVHYAAERGIPTMLVLIWFLAKIIVDFAGALKGASPGRRAFLCAGIAVVMATMLEGFFELNLGTSPPLGLFLAVVACGYVAMNSEPEAGCLPS